MEKKRGPAVLSPPFPVPDASAPLDGQKDIYHMFTPLFPNTSTRIILKKPKTDSIIPRVWLPKTLA